MARISKAGTLSPPASIAAAASTNVLDEASAAANTTTWGGSDLGPIIVLGRTPDNRSQHRDSRFDPTQLRFRWSVGHVAALFKGTLHP